MDPRPRTHLSESPRKRRRCMWMFRTKNAIRVIATASALATGLVGPGRAAADQGGLPEVRRDLQQEVAERKAADVARANATQAALATRGAGPAKASAAG